MSTVPAPNSPEPTVVDRPSRYAMPTREELRGHHGVRLVAMFLAFAFALIGMSAGCHAYVRSNNQKNYASSHFPIAGAHAEVHTLDIVQIGVVLTVGCGSLFVSSFFAMIAPHVKIPFYQFGLEWLTLAFWSVWIMACSIAFTIIARDNIADVSATLNGVALPRDVAYGNIALDVRYWHHGYLRFFACVTWATLFFSVIATWVSFKSRTYFKNTRPEIKA